MKDIVTKIPKVNFTTSALTIFSPTGEVVSINKIKDFNYHIEYLMVLYKVNKEVRKVLSGVDFSYYLKNPAEVIKDLIPQFAKREYGMQMNLTPNTMQPTNLAVLFLPEHISPNMQDTFLKLKEQEKPIEFLDIGKYQKEKNTFVSCIEKGETGIKSYQNLYQSIEDEDALRTPKKR